MLQYPVNSISKIVQYLLIPIFCEHYPEGFLIISFIPYKSFQGLIFSVTFSQAEMRCLALRCSVIILKIQLTD